MTEAELLDIYQKILLAQKKGLLHSVINDARRGLRYTKKIDNNHLRCQFAFIIHYYNFVIKQDAKAGRRAAKELETARKLRDTEEKARTGYTELTYKLNRSKRASESLRNELKSYCLEFEPIIELKNITISLYVFPMLIAQAYLISDYTSVIRYCEQAITLSKEKGQNKSQHFYLFMMSALIISKQHKKAARIVQDAKKRLPGKRYNWSVYVYFETINLIHAQQYKQAYERLLEADKKEQINPAMKEQWQIAKGFFQILSNANLVENSIRFRISKLINEVPIFNKDKYGNFINILILKIILGIQENRVRLIEEREAIEKAYQRYCLKGSREQLFLRILLRVPMLHFRRERVDKACAEDIKKLKLLPMRAESIDIIPWDKLLEIVLGELD